MPNIYKYKKCLKALNNKEDAGV